VGVKEHGSVEVKEMKRGNEGRNSYIRRREMLFSSENKSEVEEVKTEMKSTK
jgi:hypothetical protein